MVGGCSISSHVVIQTCRLIGCFDNHESLTVGLCNVNEITRTLYRNEAYNRAKEHLDVWMVGWQSRMYCLSVIGEAERKEPS